MGHTPLPTHRALITDRLLDRLAARMLESWSCPPPRQGMALPTWPHNGAEFAARPLHSRRNRPKSALRVYYAAHNGAARVREPTMGTNGCSLVAGQLRVFFRLGWAFAVTAAHSAAV